ncbi:MAG: TIGR02453 family protein [Paracoccaceae bacterium]
MSDPFSSLIPDARAFLGELAENNSKEWFTTNKLRYDDKLKDPALALLDVISAQWGAEIGVPLKPKLFRAHRDVRFSKDKTPYHTHLHLLWAEEDGPGWFFGISPDYVTAGGGRMGFDKDALELWRASVDGPKGTELAEVLSRFEGRIDEPELKRVPAPYDKDHPQSDLLRRKSLTLWQDIEISAKTDGPVTAILNAFRAVRPATDLLRQMS